MKNGHNMTITYYIMTKLEKRKKIQNSKKYNDHVEKFILILFG